MLRVLLLFAAVVSVAVAIPYQEYILAPTSRTVRPVSVFRHDGPSTSPEALLDHNVGSGQSLVLRAFNASVTYDFGKNVGGWVNFNVSSASGNISFTFSESSLWVSSWGCDSTSQAGRDAPIVFNVSSLGHFAAPTDMERGAFRYLTIVDLGAGNATVDDLWIDYTPMPHWDDLQNYTGWFHSNDEKLNRVWYAGAYTDQIVTIDPTRGAAVVSDVLLGNQTNGDGTVPWFLNFTIANGTSVLTDGAKRDRLVWPGDMSIAVPSIAVSTYDLISLRNGLDSLVAYQSSDGMFPYAGFPVPLGGIVSYTYHLHTLINLYNYFQWSGDQVFLSGVWDAWKAGMAWATDQIDTSGLANVTASSDWLRSGMGGHNIEANAILLYTLNLGVSLAHVQSDTDSANLWSSFAAAIPPAAQTLLWDSSSGLFRDNETTEGALLLPQDGNAWAIKAGLFDSPEQATQITKGLQARWTEWGAPAPEAQNAVSPFVTGFELEAHFLTNRTDAALTLIRKMWADFMLDDPRMTNSTFIEGYSATGELHYPPYPADDTISYAHGWSSGPTGSLTTFVGGIRILTNAGETWTIAPQPGDLSEVDCGFATVRGQFTSKWIASKKIFRLKISTPVGTKGSVGLPLPGHSTKATLTSGGRTAQVHADSSGRAWIEDVAGGEHEFVVVVA